MARLMHFRYFLPLLLIICLIITNLYSKTNVIPSRMNGNFTGLNPLMSGPWPAESFFLHTPDESILPQHRVCKNYNHNLRSQKLVHPFLYGNLPYDLDRGGVTLYTHMSPDRLEKLLQICRYWPGPISASIGGNATTIEKLKHVLKDGIDVLKGRNNVWIHGLVHEMSMYPVNILRNIALYHAPTDFVFHCDVDFIPMSSTYEAILKRIQSGNVFKETAYIIPAFQADITDYKMPKSKYELQKQTEKRIVQPFMASTFPEGHGPTNFTRWWNSTVEYRVNYQRYFEPYVLAWKPCLPWYHSLFLGRDLDKISYMWALDYIGVPFVVLPDVFIVHMLHPEIRSGGVAYTCASEVFDTYKQMLRYVNHTTCNT